MAKKDKTIIDILDPVEELEKAVNARLDTHQNVIYAGFGVVVIGFITIIIAVFAIFIDHENYAAQKQEQYINLLQEQIDKLENAEVMTTETKNENINPPEPKKEEVTNETPLK